MSSSDNLPQQLRELLDGHDQKTAMLSGKAKTGYWVLEIRSGNAAQDRSADGIYDVHGPVRVVRLPDGSAFVVWGADGLAELRALLSQPAEEWRSEFCQLPPVSSSRRWRTYAGPYERLVLPIWSEAHDGPEICVSANFPSPPIATCGWLLDRRR